MHINFNFYFQFLSLDIENENKCEKFRVVIEFFIVDEIFCELFALPCVHNREHHWRESNLE